jgi:hypothetical protein
LNTRGERGLLRGLFFVDSQAGRCPTPKNAAQTQIYSSHMSEISSAAPDLFRTRLSSVLGVRLMTDITGF